MPKISSEYVGAGGVGPGVSESEPMGIWSIDQYACCPSPSSPLPPVGLAISTSATADVPLLVPLFEKEMGLVVPSPPEEKEEEDEEEEEDLESAHACNS